MSLMLALLLVSAGPGDAGSMRYETSRAGPVSPADVVHTPFAVGEEARVAVDGANLRAQPSLEASVVTTLPFLARVTVLEVAEPSTVGDIVQRWVRVRAGATEGYLFGVVLTRLGGEAQLDDDAALERWSVAHTGSFGVRVRVFDDGASEDKIAHADLRLDDDRGRGGTVHASLVRDVGPRARTLLLVSLCRAERCKTALFAYEADARRGMLAPFVSAESARPLTPTLGAPEPGAGTVAISLGDSIGLAGRWPMVICPGCGDEPAALAPHAPYEAARVKLEEEPRGPNPDVRCNAVASVVEGKHAGASLVTCLLRGAGKDGPPSTGRRRFLVRGATWRALPSADSGAFPFFPSDLDEKLMLRGKKVVPEPDGAAPPAPQPLADGFVLRPLRQHEYRAEGPVWLVHRDLGALRHLKGRDDVWVSHDVDSTAIAWTLEKQGTQLARDPGCGDGDDRFRYLVRAAGDDARPGIVDPFGRRLALQLPPREPCTIEPIVYLYPKTAQDISVRVRAVVAVSDPPMRDGSWRVHAEPDGRMTLLDGERSTRRLTQLFWEGTNGPLPPPTRGYVWKREQAPDELRRVLRERGLRIHEADDCVRAWQRTLREKPWVFVGLHAPDVVDRWAPLEVQPTPDTSLRVLLDIEPLDAPRPMEPPDLPSPPARTGFVLVEWGGILRSPAR
jgi:Bacterial SH3 domain